MEHARLLELVAGQVEEALPLEERVGWLREHAERGLIEHVARWAEANGLDAITLTTFTDVVWNGPYYERCGFRLLAESELTPGLRAIRAEEAAHGLDRWPRACMRREL